MIDTILPSRTIASLWNKKRLRDLQAGTAPDAGRDPLSCLRRYSVATDEIALLGAHGKAEASFQHMILVGDVMAEMAIGFFDPAAIQRVNAAELQTEIRACLFDGFEDMGGLIGRDIKFPAKFADIGNAMGAGETHAGFDLARPYRKDEPHWRNHSG